MKNKTIVLVALAAVLLLPAAAMTSPSAETPQGAGALSSRLETAASSAGAIPAEGSLTDEELVQVSGQSNVGLSPWQGLVPETEMVTRIKLWDEPDRVPKEMGILKMPGSLCSGALAVVGTKP